MGLMPGTHYLHLCVTAAAAARTHVASRRLPALSLYEEFAFDYDQ